MGEVLTNGVYLPDRGERNAYDGLKGNWNTLDSIAGKVPGYDGHISDTDIHVTAADKQTWNGKADASHVHNADDVTTGVFDAARIPNLDASKITTGTIDIDRLPQGALERLVKVADQAARYALTTSDVQLGDTVQQLDTGVMYVVTDVTKLDSADGYTEYTAGSATSVPWSGVTGKPADYTPASHSHGNITNDGKVGTAANKPLITGTDGVVQAGSFGNAANTFCEGNDSRLSDARTPVAHTHTKSDVTDLFNSANTWSGEQTFSQTIQGNAATASAFDTAKSITLTGAVTGTVSGTDSWEIATVLKTGSARTGGTVTNPYFKIASWEVAPNKYFGAILQIQNKCYPEDIATLIISVRTKSNATFQRGGCLLTNVHGFTSNDFILLYKEVTGKVLCELYFYTTVSFNGIRFSVISEGVGIQEDNSLFNTMVVYRDPTGIAALPSDYTVIQTTIGTYTQDFIPYSNNTYNLGTSTNKWKTLNGVNPGALSLPDYTLANVDFIDFSQWSVSGQRNDYTPDSDGWLFVNIRDTASNSIFIYAHSLYNADPTIATDYSVSCFGNGSQGVAGRIAVMLPVRAGIVYGIFIKAASVSEILSARFYPALGNV